MRTPITWGAESADVDKQEKQPVLGSRDCVYRAQRLAITKVVSFTKKGQGKLVYAKAGGCKYIGVNKTTGKVTVKKGLRKGVHRVKVMIKAAGNGNYKASTVKKATFRVRVK